MPVSRCLSQFVITAAALALATMLSAPAEDNSAAVSTHLVVHRYRVKGQNARAIRHSLRKNGPLDLRGISRDAFTSWAIKWRWPEGSGKMVDSDLIQISLEAKIVLPHLMRQAEQKNPAWRRYYQALVRHELQHFQFALNGSELLAAQFRRVGQHGRISVSDAHRLGRQAVDEVRENDRRYDSLTDHGRTEGIRWGLKLLAGDL